MVLSLGNSSSCHLQKIFKNGETGQNTAFYATAQKGILLGDILFATSKKKTSFALIYNIKNKQKTEQIFFPLVLHAFL